MPILQQPQARRKRYAHRKPGGCYQQDRGHHFHYERQSHTGRQYRLQYRRQHRHHRGCYSEHHNQLIVLIPHQLPAHETPASRSDISIEKITTVSVSRMPEEQHEFLNQRHFDQNVTRSDSEEIQQE